MNLKYICFAVALLLFANRVIAQTGCTDPAAINYDSSATVNDGSCIYPLTYQAPVLKGYFASYLSESSGLVWTDGKLWTHNDSGNPAIIYSIDTATGATLQEVNIDNFPNTDWEDITADSNYIYVGNFGNNDGARRDLSILKIKKADIGASRTVHVTAEEIAFSYTDQTSFTASRTNNFDCESVLSRGDSLYIFTKDRGDLQTRVYKLPKIPGTYRVSPYTSLNANGLVTGADYDPINNEVMLIGYLSDHTHPFLWKLNDFAGDMFFSGNKRRIEIGNSEEWQTEGICYLPGHRYFISCESLGTIHASLYVSDENWKTNLEVNDPEQGRMVHLYPNPVNDLLTITGSGITDYKIYAMNGVQLQEGVIESGYSSINISNLSPGLFMLALKAEDGTIVTRELIKQ